MTNKEIEALWNEYYPKVFGYFYRRLSHRQDIEDITSICLTYFIKKLQEDDGVIQNENAYLWRICHNQLATFIASKSKILISVPYDDEWIAQDTALETTRSREFEMRIESLKACIQKFTSETEWDIISLSFFEELSSVQIAQQLNSTSAAIRKRLSRALQKVRTHCFDLWKTYA